VLPESKIVYDRHEVYEQFKNFLGISLFHLFEKYDRNSVNGVITVSEDYENKLSQLFPWAIVKTVPNYPLSSVYDTKLIERKIDLLDEISQISAIYIGSLGNMDRDVDLLLKIADAILTTFPDAEFIVGGNYLNNESRKKIDQISQKFETRFQFHGYVQREKTIQLTQEAHLGFFLIRPDTHYWVKFSANKIFEYLMCGVVPIIRADVEDAAELQKCSLIFDRNDSDAKIISEILDLLKNREKLQAFMRSSRETSMNYRWEFVASRYIELYRMVLS
jgi:glycosyltransferase involved in cell wall biosynthesis